MATRLEQLEKQLEQHGVDWFNKYQYKWDELAKLRNEKKWDEERVELWYTGGMQERVNAAFPNLPFKLAVIKYIEKLENELFGETL